MSLAMQHLPLTDASWDLSISGSGCVLCPEFGVSGCYSIDGKYFFAVLRYEVRVYVLKTRQCIKVIPLHNEVEVVDVVVIEDIIYVILQRQVFKVDWKKKNGNNVHETVQFNIKMAIMRDELMFISQDNGLNLVDYHGKLIHSFGNVQNLVKSLNNQFILTLANNILYRYDVVANTTTEFAFNYKSPIISMAISNDGLIALGSQLGPIQIIFNDNQEKVLKWHIGPVKLVYFAPGPSNFLISGGIEKVMVIWQIITDKIQFLPRLNGSIDKIFIDRHQTENYNLLLNINDKNYEILILSSVDLVSRLSVNSPRPQNISNKNHIANVVEVHPKTEELYIPYDSVLLTFNVDKYEQVHHQNLSPSIGIGKVRSELKLNDPQVTHLKFTESGDVMCTFDKYVTNDENLNSEVIYALKFWKFKSSWELITKIINPHYSQPIMAMKYYQEGFITVDNKFNIRYWKFKKGTWVLVKNKVINYPETKAAINVEVSQDSSLIVMNYENNLELFTSNFVKIDINLNLSDSNIRSIKIIGDDLIVLSKTRISSFNLITFTSNNMHKFSRKIPIGSDHLFSVSNDTLALALNSQESSTLILLDKKLKPIYSFQHSCPVICLMRYNGSFLFIDINRRIGRILNGATRLYINEAAVEDIDIGIDILSNVMNGNGNALVEDIQQKSFDYNSFLNIFNTENLDGLFDKIIRIVES